MIPAGSYIPAESEWYIFFYFRTVPGLVEEQIGEPSGSKSKPIETKKKMEGPWHNKQSHQSLVVVGLHQYKSL